MKKCIALCLVLVLMASCCLSASAQAIEPMKQEVAVQLDRANENIDFDDLLGKVKPKSMFIPTFTVTETTEGRWVEYEGGRYYHYDWQQFIQYQVTFSNGKSQIFSGTQFIYQNKQYNLIFTDPQSPENPWTAGNTYQVPISLGDVTATMKITIKPGEDVPGDFTGDAEVTNEDVIYLLWHTLFPESYPLETEVDFTGDDQLTNEDVIYLLWHTLFPETFPL